MAITVGTTTQNAAQTQPNKSQMQANKSQAQAGKSQNKAEPQVQAGRSKTAAVKAAIAPSIKQAAQLVSNPVAQVAVKAAAGAVGALLDTKA